MNPILIYFIPQKHGSLTSKLNLNVSLHKEILNCQLRIYNYIVTRYLSKNIKINIYSEDSLYYLIKNKPVLRIYNDINSLSFNESLFKYGASKLLKINYPHLVNLVPLMLDTKHSLRQRINKLISTQNKTRTQKKTLHNMIYQNRETEVLSKIYQDQLTNNISTNILIFGAAHNFLSYNKYPGINKLFNIKLIPPLYFKQLLKYSKRKSKTTQRKRISPFRSIKTKKT